MCTTHPLPAQMLPLRSHHFQKVGKKPELTLVWEPEDLEQEPVQQVRRGGAAFPEPLRIPVCPALQRAPFCLVGCPPRAPVLGPPALHPTPPSPPFGPGLPGSPLWGEAGPPSAPLKQGVLSFGVHLRR